VSFRTVADGQPVRLTARRLEQHVGTRLFSAHDHRLRRDALHDGGVFDRRLPARA